MLDDFVSAERQARGTDLGLISVPMELVVGTVNNARTNAAGGNDYFESGVVHPELVLRDLIKIFHPELVEEDFVYYKRLK